MLHLSVWNPQIEAIIEMNQVNNDLRSVSKLSLSSRLWKFTHIIDTAIDFCYIFAGFYFFDLVASFDFTILIRMLTSLTFLKLLSFEIFECVNNK